MNKEIKKICFILFITSAVPGKNLVRSETLLSDLDLVVGDRVSKNQEHRAPSGKNSDGQGLKVLEQHTLSAPSDGSLASHRNPKIALNIKNRGYHETRPNAGKIKATIGKLAANNSKVYEPSSSSEEILIQKRNQPAKLTPYQDVSKSNESTSGNSTVIADVTKEVTIREILETSTEYHFSTFGREDPFKPSVKDINEAAEIIKDGSPVTSILQEHDLKDLKLVGVWKASNGGPKAMVSAPQGSGMIVQTGDLIGTKGGRILDILEDRLVVREFLVSIDGTRQFEDRQLMIQSKITNENPAVSDLPEVPKASMNPLGAGATAVPQRMNPVPVTPQVNSQGGITSPVSASPTGTLSTQKLLYDYKSISDQGAANTNTGTKPVMNR